MKPDIDIVKHGDVIRIVYRTRRAKRWLQDNETDDVVPAKELAPLVVRMQDAGLQVNFA